SIPSRSGENQIVNGHPAPRHCFGAGFRMSIPCGGGAQSGGRATPAGGAGGEGLGDGAAGGGGLAGGVGPGIRGGAERRPPFGPLEPPPARVGGDANAQIGHRGRSSQETKEVLPFYAKGLVAPRRLA